MKFGSVRTGEAEGCILAHATRVGAVHLAKGHRLTSADLRVLGEAGIEEIVAARLDAEDVSENEAAATIGKALASALVAVAPAATGRANLFARASGVFLPDRGIVDALNRVDPGLTLATLAEFAPVEAGRMVATVKIIPLAVPSVAVDKAVALLADRAAFRLAPFRPRGVGLVQTVLPGTKPSVLDKTAEVLKGRLALCGCTLLREVRVGHESGAAANALRASVPAEEMTIVFGASAVIDEDDVVPDAVRVAGGDVVHLGMPVDPGNLLLLGRIGERTVIGAPGCARSARENGFDWILNRILADLPVGSQDITALGVGGLLMEIASRPQPREAAGDKASKPRVAILLLAAGRSSRMGGSNKLLATFDGVPLLRRSAQTALGVETAGVHVVLGHRADELARTLDGLDLQIHRNADFAEGLSTSLRLGFAAAARGADGVLVMLADQPLLTSEHIARLIGSFRPAGEGSIVLACDGDRRANPVLLPVGLRGEIEALQGDIGARSIVQAHRDLVREVDIGPAASFDVDTPDLLARAGGIPA